jgi:phosphohistidine phosphatase SixA
MPVLLLVRHASAGDRGIGPGDLERPLDARGQAQAAALPGVLAPHLAPHLSADIGVDLGAAGSAKPHVDVRSSPARRCIETVRPLATALGTDVTVDPALVEGCDIRALHDRLATLTGPTVWSSHGDVIPELLEMLSRRGLDLGTSPSCRKGSTWVVQVTDGEARTATSLPPPA